MRTTGARSTPSTSSRSTSSRGSRVGSSTVRPTASAARCGCRWETQTSTARKPIRTSTPHSGCWPANTTRTSSSSTGCSTRHTRRTSAHLTTFSTWSPRIRRYSGTATCTNSCGPGCHSSTCWAARHTSKPPSPTSYRSTRSSAIAEQPPSSSYPTAGCTRCGENPWFGYAPPTSADLQVVQVGAAGRGGGGGAHGVEAGVQRRGDGDGLPGGPGAGGREGHLAGDEDTVDGDVHRPAGGAAVGVPELQRRAARPGGVAGPLHVAADQVVVVDETGAGEAGVVGLGHALEDRRVLGLVPDYRRGGRLKLCLQEVDVGSAAGGGGGRPDRVGTRVQRHHGRHRLPGAPRPGRRESQLVREQSAVGGDVHRPVRGAAVGVPERQGRRTRLCRVHRPVHVAADHGVVVDVAGPGEAGHCGLHHTLGDRRVL